MMSGFNTNASTLFNTNSTFTNQQQQSQQPQHQYQQPQQQQQQQQQQQPQQQRERLPSFLFSPSAVNNNNNSNNNNPNRPSPSSSIANTTTPSVITTPTETDTFNDDSFNQQSQNMNANPWPFDNQSSRGMNQSSSRSQGIAFNDRLRIDRSYNDTTNMNPVSFENNSMMNSQQQQQNRASSRLPPSKSLLDSGPPSVMQLRTPSSTPSTHGRPTSTPVTTNAPSMPSSTPTPRFVSSAPSPGMSPYNTANANNNNDQNTPSNVNNELVNRWITVFGFSGSETESQALREFRRHGDIVRTVPGKGNWIHILYRTQLQAQVALYRPWRILTGTDIMIGVVPCTEPEIAKSEDETIEKGFLVASPANHSNNLYPMSPSPNTPQTQSPSQVARMKSPGGGTGLRTPSDLLRRGGRSGNDDMRVGGANNMEDSAQRTQTIVQTPQRQTGIFEYISGFYK